MGRDFTGEGVTVAIIDSGVDVNDPRMAGAHIEGWSIELSATGHALLHPNFADEHGHGTMIAAAVRRLAPRAKIVSVKIMGAKRRTTAELMAAGIETAARNGAHVINLSLGTPNMGKALKLRECCAQALDLNAVVLAAAHPRGERAYPADLPEPIGVASDPSCPFGRIYYYDPNRFPRKAFPTLTDKFLTHGQTEGGDEAPRYLGSGLATAYLSGTMACLRQAFPRDDAYEAKQRLSDRAHVPVPELGYA